VNVWNVGTQTIHASFAQRHASAATALAFSPVSEWHAHLHTRTHMHSHAVAAVSQPGEIPHDCVLECGGERATSAPGLGQRCGRRHWLSLHGGCGR
jgi:hypothetical protein